MTKETEIIRELEAKADRHASVGDYIDRYAAEVVRECIQIIKERSKAK